MVGTLFFDIVIIFAGAFAGGLVARLLRFPIILGYLVVGAIVGPHTLGAVGNPETVRTLAEIGVILLLFEVGVEVSFQDLRRLGRVVVLGGVAQIVVTIGLLFPLGLQLGWPYQQALVFGLVASLSSTMVVLKTLTDRGEIGSVHGRVIVGILVVQDLAFIPMVAILPSLSGDGSPALIALGFGVLKATVILALMVLLGGRAIPWLLDRVVIMGSREIFILSVVALTFATAALTDAFGLSLALGAFVSGLVLSESTFGRRALTEIIPVRDMFAAVFFVSLGMLTDPAFVVDHIGTVLVVVSAVTAVKLILITGLVRAFGYLPHTALLTGFGMFQIGEFSFFLAGSAATLAIVDSDFLTLIVVSAVLTMAITPLMLGAGVRVVGILGRHFRTFQAYRPSPQAMEFQIGQLSDHLVLCGLGRIGTMVARALKQHEIPFVVIDLDHHVVQLAVDSGYLVVNGSSSSDIVLEQAGIAKARMMVITTGDPNSARVTAERSLKMNPQLDIVARVRWQEEAKQLQHLGVQEVVWPDLEGGLEILRHSLLRYYADIQEVERLTGELRNDLEIPLIPEAPPPEGAAEPDAQHNT